MRDRRPNQWLVLTVMSLGVFMTLLDGTIVSVAIPNIMGSLRAPVDHVLWVVDSYLVVFAVVLIPAARWGDVVGQRAAFATGLIVFGLGSLASGLAQDGNQLVAARVAQGFGAAVLTPQALAMITLTFPPERRGSAFGLWGAVQGLGAIVGPTVGGVLTTYASWRWIFFVNLPVVLIALIALLAFVPVLRTRRRHSFDPVGVVLVAAGLFSVTFGLIEGQRYNWGSLYGPITVPVLILVGAIMLALFLVWESRQNEPLIPLAMFGNRNFSLMNAAGLAVAFGVVGFFVVYYIYLETALGMSALSAGLTSVPFAVVAFFVAPIAGRIHDRVGGGWLIGFALLALTAGIGELVWISGTATSWYEFLPGFVVAGLGIGCFFGPQIAIAMEPIAPPQVGAASGILSAARQFGQVLGPATVGAMLQNRMSISLGAQSIMGGGNDPAELLGSFTQMDHVGQQHLANAYITSMRTALMLPVVILAFGAFSCFAVKRRRIASEEDTRDSSSSRRTIEA